MIVVDGVEMVDVKEAASLVGRTPETVRRWVWTARIGSVKHGNKLLLARDEVVALGGGGRAAGQAITLHEWAERVRSDTTAGEPGATAKDLVLADRSARGSGAARAGR